jgi:hypothetical protein
MQQKQQDPFYPEYQQPTNFRFASNRPASQSPYPAPIPQAPSKHRKKERRPRRRRIFTWWNLFAVIGIITVIIQTIRYVIVPLLVMLEPYWEKLMGGVA